MDAHEPPADARDVGRRLNRLLRLAPVVAAGSAASLAVGVAASVAALVVLAGILDTLVTRPGTSPRDLTSPLVWLASLVLLRAACAAVLELCSQRLATTITAHVRRSLVAAVLERGPRLLRQPAGADRVGEIVADIADGVAKLEGYYRRYLPQVVSAAITPPAILVVAFWIDPASGAILAVTAPLVAVFLWLVGARAEALARRQWRTLRALSGLFLDTLQGLTTMMLFRREGDAIARLDESGERYRAATMRVLRAAFLSGLVLDLAATLSTALVAVGVGVRLVEGWMAFGPAIAVLLLTPEIYAPLRQLGQRRHAGMEAMVAAERLFECMPTDVAPAADRVVEPEGVGADRAARELAVCFERVSFTYPDADRPALSHIEFELQPRTVTAIVGPTGAGKSTLVDLLLRFAEPTTGAIVVNGRDIATIDPHGWRRDIALVPQRPQFIDGSILDNLCVGRPGASLEEIRAAARRAEIDAFVMSLPAGYDTSLGEMAGRASVGERQRLALARALVRQAPLFVLDEPSSSLDPPTEAAIARVIVEESRRRTVVVVTHRLRTARAADRLLVLDAGRLVESGRHDDLMLRGGLYARFVGSVELEPETAT